MYRSMVFVFVFCSAILFLCAHFLHDRAAEGSVIAIEALSPRGEFLASEVLAFELNGVQVWKYRVTNQTRHAIELAVRHVSCGCVAFQADAVPIAPEQWWTVDAGESSIVGMTGELPAPSQPTRRSFVIVARSLGHHKVLAQEPISLRLAVHRDISVYPSALRFSLDGEEKVLTLTVVRASGDLECEPAVQVPAHLTDLITVGVSPKGEPDILSENLRLQTFLVQLLYRRQPANSHHSVAAALPYPGVGKLRISLGGSSGIPCSAGARAILIPIVVEDSLQLEAVESIDFGVATRGTEVARTLFVSTRDGGQFAFADYRQQGPGTVHARFTTDVQARSSAVVSVIFSASSAGEYDGTLTLFPAGGAYFPLRVKYRAEVR
jgi:hypothetical protein